MKRIVSKSLWASVFLMVFLSGIASAAETVETRKNKKGKVDEWIYRKNGVVYKKEYDRNGDGKPDLRIFQSHGLLVRKEYDNNFDGKFEAVEKPLSRGSDGIVKTMDTENAKRT